MVRGVLLALTVYAVSWWAWPLATAFVTLVFVAGAWAIWWAIRDRLRAYVAENRRRREEFIRWARDYLGDENVTVTRDRRGRVRRIHTRLRYEPDGLPVTDPRVVRPPHPGAA